MVDKKSSPSNTREQANQIKEAWTNIGQDAAYGDISLSDFTAALEALEKTEDTIRNLEDQLTNARNMLVKLRYELWELVKRARNGAKAKHGDDSSQYERFGGTRMSERSARSKNKDDKAPA
jgi:hypothetical protein